MKKALVITLVAVVMLVGFSVVAMADSMDATIPLTVTIPASFGFVLDKYTHDFGTVNTSEGGETTFGIFCRSNHGLVWKLQVQADEFSNGAGGILPSDPNFIQAAWTGPAVDDPLTPDDDESIGHAAGLFGASGPIPSVAPYDIYTSTIGEGGSPFTAITMGVYLSVPGAQASGLYSTDLIITMYE